MNLGIRAHDFGKMSVDALTDTVANKGFTSIQLALAKALDGINTETGCQSPGLAYTIREAFYKKNIQIAVLGCYINPIHPDLEERQSQLTRFKEHIRFAREFGCSIVGTETGSYHANCSFHPDNKSEEAFHLLVESVAQLVEEAEKFGVFVGIEAVTTHTIYSPQRMKRVLDTIQSNNLQVIFDPVNLMSMENYGSQDDVIKESFELFGDRIVAVHAKNFIVEDNAIKSAPIHRGMLNYPLFLKLLKERKPHVNILFEDTRGEATEESKKFITDIYNNL